MILFCEIISRKDFLVKSGCHPSDSLLIVLEGEFSCTIGEKSLKVSSGDVFAFPAKMPFVRSIIKPIKCIYIQFSSFFIPLPPGVLSFSDLQRKESTVNYLKTAVENDNTFLTEHYVRDLFLLLESKNSRNPFPDNTAEECMKYIRENLEKPLTLDRLASELCISKQGLIYKFRKHTGQTPIAYLNAVRIRRAKQMLGLSGCTLEQIAANCGFANVYYFSNCFKKACGISPGAYRQKAML